IFPMPQERLDAVPAVPGTDGRKMSKSYGNTIEIFAEGKALKKSVMTDIVTDKATVEDKKDPDQSNIFALYKLFATDAEREEMAAKFRAGGMGYGVAKTALLEKIDSYFAPARERRKELAANPEYVECALREGAKRARAEAQKTMELVRK